MSISPLLILTLVPRLTSMIASSETASCMVLLGVRNRPGMAMALVRSCLRSRLDSPPARHASNACSATTTRHPSPGLTGKAMVICWPDTCGNTTGTWAAAG